MRKTIFILAFCSFLLFMFVGWKLTLWMGERDLKKGETQSLQVSKTEPRIQEQTKIIYQYLYTEDRGIKEQIESAPLFLQGMNMQQLKSIYQGWQILLFSPEKVILQCKVNGLSKEAYILGESDGFVSVFYEDEQKRIHLKEKTSIPISSLPKGEAKKIREGLMITGEENLAKILADLGS